MDINRVRELCSDKKLRWTNHIFIRLTQRSISMADVENAMMEIAVVHYSDKVA